MYINIVKEMAEKRITLDAIAKTLNVHRNTLANKLFGKGRFYSDEILEIRNCFFPDKTLEELCERKISK